MASLRLWDCFSAGVGATGPKGLLFLQNGCGVAAWGWGGREMGLGEAGRTAWAAGPRPVQGEIGRAHV